MFTPPRLPRNIDLLSSAQTFLDQHLLTEICEAFNHEAVEALKHCASSEFAMSLVANFAAAAVAGTAGRFVSRGILATGLRVLKDSRTVIEFEKVAFRQLVKSRSVHLLALRFTAGAWYYFVNASVFNRLMGHGGGIQNIRTAADFALMHPGSLLAQHLLKQVSPLPLRLFADFLLGGINFCFSSGARVALENIVHPTHDTFAAHFSVGQVLEGGAMHLGNKVAEWGTNNISTGLKSVFHRVQNLFSEFVESPVEMLDTSGSLVYMKAATDLPASTAPQATRRIATHDELLQVVDTYEASYLFVGHGSKSQYANVSEVLPQIEEVVERLNTTHGKGRWLAIFGGDNFNPEKPDIAHIMRHLKEQLGVPVLAIQSDVVLKKWHTPVDSYVDYAHYVETDYYRDEAGAEKIYWGGFDGSKLLGPTRVYLGESFTRGASPQRPRLNGVIAVGGGPIGLQEAQYAHSKNIPIIYIRARARHTEVNGEFGSLDSYFNTPASRLGSIFEVLGSKNLFTTLLLIDLLNNGQSYGSEIIKRIKASTGLELKQATLYPLLKLMSEELAIIEEVEGLQRVREEGGERHSAGGRPRIYYKLTRKGEEMAKDLRDGLRDYLR